MRSCDRRTILVIDDDDDLASALTKRLTSLGFRCITAASGAEGLARFRSAQVDLIVSDLNMPGGDGVELAEAIRMTSDLPIIFVTGYRYDFRRRLRRVPNVTILRKPFMCQDLIDLITAALGESAASPLPVNTELENP